MPEYNKNDLEVSNKLGALQSSLDSIEKKLDDHIVTYTTKIKDVDDHMGKVNILFGKIGLVTIAIGAIVATIFNFAGAWIKKQFNIE